MTDMPDEAWFTHNKNWNSLDHMVDGYSTKYIRADLNEWQDIETAPRDTFIKGVVQGEQSPIPGITNPVSLPAFGKIEEHEGNLYFATYDQWGHEIDNDAPMPTHWKPLDKPPEGE